MLRREGACWSWSRAETGLRFGLPQATFLLRKGKRPGVMPLALNQTWALADM